MHITRNYTYMGRWCIAKVAWVPTLPNYSCLAASIAWVPQEQLINAGSRTHFNISVYLDPQFTSTLNLRSTILNDGVLCFASCATDPPKDSASYTGLYCVVPQPSNVGSSPTPHPTCECKGMRDALIEEVTK